MTTIGKVEDLTRQFIFEWSIDDFVSLSVEQGSYYSSPTFLIDREPWCLHIYPNGDSRDKSVGYIGVYLNRVSSGPSKSLIWSLYLKTVDGKKDCVTQHSYEFTEKTGLGSNQFLKRSELLEKKSTLAPSNNLTVVCTIEFCSKSTDETSCSLTDSCSYCKKYFNNDLLSTHEQKCLDKPIKCPTCSDVVELKKWLNHECPMRRIKANEKLVSDLAGIFDSKENSDVTIIVKDEKFHLHRNILAGRNNYFKSMFSTEMQEKATGTITIEDCEPKNYYSFLFFIYTGKVDSLSMENICAVYDLADKYQEDQLKEECVAYIKKEMRADTFCDFIVLILTHGETELLEDATDLFCREIKDIIPTVKWQSFMKQYPTQANELSIKAVNYMSNKLQEITLKT